MPNSNFKDAPVIVPYSFSTDLLNDMGYHEEPIEENQMDIEDSFEEKGAVFLESEKQATQIIESAQLKASEILAEAEKRAQEIEAQSRELGYQDGFALGKEEGKETAYQENKEQLEIEAEIFLQELQSSIAEFEKKKEELVKKYSHELCNLALTIAEKIIKISLKSSTEVITKMILSATEKSKNKEWARIHISNHDASLMAHGETEILNAVQHISPHVKVVIMENEQPGTCIIEFPDQIIDASVNTQLENIKGLLDDNKLDGGL